MRCRYQCFLSHKIVSHFSLAQNTLFLCRDAKSGCVNICMFSQMQEAIRYLEFCVEKLGNRDTAIHNFLLSLYAKQNDKTLLLKYLYKYSKVCPPVCVCLVMSTGVLLG